MTGLLLALCLSATEVPADVQSTTRMLAAQMETLPQPKVGQWVTYQFNGGGAGDRVHYWRLAIVAGERDDKGREALWLEIDIGAHPKMASPMLQMKFLYATSVGLSAEGVTRAIVGYGFEKPVELDSAAIAKLFTKQPSQEEAPPPGPKATPASLQIATRVGKQSRLVTAAGSVSATPVEVFLRQTVVKRIWLSPQVPILGLARMEVPAIEHTMEVRDFGIDAHPQMIMPAPGTPKVGVERYDEQASFPPDEAAP